MKAFCVLLLLLCSIEYSFAMTIDHSEKRTIVLTPETNKTVDVICRLPALTKTFHYSASKVEIIENITVITLTNKSVVVAPVNSCIINKDGK